MLSIDFKYSLLSPLKYPSLFSCSICKLFQIKSTIRGGSKIFRCLRNKSLSDFLYFFIYRKFFREIKFIFYEI